MKDKILRTLAEMENVKERTKRESENSKKFTMQNYAKGLLDVADNLGRASSAAKESFPKIDEPEATVGAFRQHEVLLQGVEMIEKQLLEVFGKFDWRDTILCMKNLIQTGIMQCSNYQILQIQQIVLQLF